MKLINQWAYQWKILFNPDPTKQATEVSFSYKLDNVPHEPLTFNTNKIQSTLAQKHMGPILGSKLEFKQDIKSWNKLGLGLKFLRILFFPVALRNG